MPPQPYLPFRDGRHNASHHPNSSIVSGHHNDAFYYSNEDIELLHEIVEAGEAIYPTLPERDRLPTNALFQAAEQVLPNHGYDPEHAPANISRLIFRIGGLRSEGSLMDKFKSVLASMGIEIEFVQSIEPEAPRSTPSITAVSSSSAGNVDQTGTFPISPLYIGRRRRNSDTAAESQSQVQREVHRQLHRPRSHSLSESKRGQGSVSGRETRAEHEPSSPFQRPQERLGDRHFSDVDTISEVESTNDLPRLTHGAPFSDDETGGGLSHVSDLTQVEHVEAPQQKRLALQPRTFRTPSSRTADRLEWFLGASDFTVQTSADQAPLLLNHAEATSLEKKLWSLRRRHRTQSLLTVLREWAQISRDVRSRRLHMESLAAEEDKRTLLSEASCIWKENAEASQQAGQLAAGPALHPLQEAKMERRAERAHSLLLLYKAFTHWGACTRDEANRTAVARRHILRKRCFSAWRAQQSLDNARLHKFRLQRVLRVWEMACIYYDVRERISIQRHQQGLMKQALGRWRDEYLTRLADKLRMCRMKELCARTWRFKTQVVVAQHLMCVVYDEKLLLEDAIATWQAALEETRAFDTLQTRRHNATMCHRIMNQWQIQATLKKQLDSFSSEKARETKERVMTMWAVAANRVSQRSLSAMHKVLGDLLWYWRHEAKRQWFMNQLDQRLKHRAFDQWRLERILLSFDHISQERTKVHTMAMLQSILKEARTQSVHLQTVADHFWRQSVQLPVLGRWKTAQAVSAEQGMLASSVWAGDVAAQCVEFWLARRAKAVAKSRRHENLVDKCVYYCTAVNTLSAWSETADRMRKERLTQTYHTLKRRYKANIATECLSKWRKITEHTMAFGTYVSDICSSQQKMRLSDYIQHWNTLGKRMQSVCDVAVGAELEVWWGKWSTMASRLRETEQDAIEYNLGRSLSRCLRSWEVSALQCKSRLHAAIDLLENKEKKLCREILYHWRHIAGLSGATQDLRSSSISRLSWRPGSVLQSSLLQVPETPRLGMSGTGIGSLPPPRPSHILDAEKGAKQITSSSLFNLLGSGVELQNPSVATPRSKPPALRLHHRLQRQHPDSGAHFRATAPPHLGTRQSVTETPVITYQGSPSSRRAAELSPIGGPASHDETSTSYTRAAWRQTGEISASGLDNVTYSSPRRVGNADEDEEDNEVSLSFIRTPTRPTGSARRSEYRLMATVPASTTTPSEVLSTPYERALREGYGGLGGLRRLAGIRSAATRETPRVTFADIREESAEYHVDSEE